MRKHVRLSGNASVFNASLLLAVLSGSFLRLYQISDQIIADDEWHAIVLTLFRGFNHIRTHFGHDDHCIPLTLFYEAATRTVGLSENVMRLPVLASGIASLIIFPLLLRGLVGLRVAGIFGWLLAIAPLHVYFSRYARPYVICLFLVVAAWAAFYRWWIDGRLRWSIVYAICAAMAGYFHLFFLPAALVPLLYSLFYILAQRVKGAGRRFTPLLGVTILTTIVFFILLGPPLAIDRRVLLRKAGQSQIDWISVSGAAELLLGSGSGLLITGILAGVLFGGWSLYRKNRALLFAMMCVVGAQVASLLVLKPKVAEMPIVVARYSLVLLPILLLLLASGLSAAEDLLKSLWERYPSGALPFIACAALLALGPLRSTYYYPNAWTNHALFQYSYSSIERVGYYRMRPAKMPRFYDFLRNSPRGSLLVVEVPWRYGWYYNQYPFYQEYHRQRMKVGSIIEPGKRSVAGEFHLDQPGYEFRNIVHVGDEHKLTEFGVDYVIFHKQPIKLLPGAAADLDLWMERYRQRYREPAFEDSEIVVYKVTSAK